ncbi:EAL domain-containing protein [Radiobacillus kanasensis]|uniref:bifunctional diguanylate cyclase/phosphodiesterase n=1 Tax=Radiobacillus kanasensis TaxID=2844358 RepID=UPI001E2F87B5|nr:bifunctional diguanylate cyclase/phosphodiesterase [Radiobacillus kanasensis]UFT99189.1 EAL domain-containing protein [Radiobacillus kanasensis]
MNHLDMQYNLWIVALSFFIAVLASFSALNLAGKITRSEGKSRLAWHITGSFVMGLGVWSMHFVGMLAMEMHMPISYDPMITALSALASIIASFIAFHLTATSGEKMWRTVIGGLAMGVGIVIMHYSGMAAMHNEIQISYDPLLFTVSVIIALIASFAALYLFRRFRFEPSISRWKIICSLIMGVAICGMHYTGMAASTMTYTGAHMAVNTENQMFLLWSVSVATIFMLSASWMAIYVDRRLLERMAFNDSLTELPNRYWLNQYFQEKFTEKVEGTIFFLDLDRFKSINDTLGHDVGDLLLKEIAQRLKNAVSSNEQIFRLGGDEFLIASTNNSKTDTIELAETILEEIKKPCYIDGNVLYVTVSIGISFAPQHSKDRVELMKAADTAMYHSKGLGKNKFSIYNETMGREQQRRLGLEKDLRKALAQDEFRIVYQPKWDYGQNKMVGMEALLRWEHPALGTVSPGEFIPIAEETGLIVPITHWLLKDVCSQNKSWQREYELFIPISVNMSVRVFESQSLFHSVLAALNETQLEGKYLELEITESIAMNDVENTVQQLHQLQELGLQVSLDDFGTGYSSLGSLDEMPIHTLKIDQSFVRNSNLATKRAIITNIITIAKNLNMQIVAEGVEELEQIEFLHSNGCSVMQGYYFGKPVPPVEIMEQFLKQSKK